MVSEKKIFKVFPMVRQPDIATYQIHKLCVAWFQSKIFCKVFPTLSLWKLLMTGA